MISPAKINLGLEIPFKRLDGFHEIRSVFLKISWGDDIEIEPASNGVFELFSNNEIILEKRKLYDQVSERGDIKNNILYKTFIKARSLFPELPGVKIHLTKRISPAGGLGGGSTNAASLLNFLFSWRPFLLPMKCSFLPLKLVPMFLFFRRRTCLRYWEGRNFRRNRSSSWTRNSCVNSAGDEYIGNVLLIEKTFTRERFSEKWKHSVEKSNFYTKKWRLELSSG